MSAVFPDDEAIKSQFRKPSTKYELIKQLQQNGTHFIPPSSPNCEYESKAALTATGRSIISHDPQIQNSEEELMKYFLSNLSMPKVELYIECYHTETSSSTNSDGSSSSHTDTVTDYSMKIDITKYILPCRAIVAEGKNKDTGKPLSVQDVLKQYTDSQNAFKQIVLKKYLEWDINTLKQAMELLLKKNVKSAHISSYRFRLDIQGELVEAHADTEMAKMSQDCAVRTFCFVTCLCLIF